MECVLQAGCSWFLQQLQPSSSSCVCQRAGRLGKDPLRPGSVTTWFVELHGLLCSRRYPRVRCLNILIIINLKTHQTSRSSDAIAIGPSELGAARYAACHAALALTQDLQCLKVVMTPALRSATAA